MAPRLISSVLGPDLDAPPAPVCGAPDGGLELVGGALGVTAGDGLVVLVGDAVGVLLGVGVGELLGDSVGLGEVLGEVLVEELDPGGAVALVVYVLAPAATDTKIDCSYSTGVDPVPVPPGPFQQPMTNSSVPGVVALIPATFSSAPTLPSSVPLNELVRPASTVGEISDTRVPLRLNSAISAESW